MATDGTYTILWSQRPGVAGTLIDELTGQRTRVATPAGCPAPVGGQDFLGDTWLLVPCPHSSMNLYALATGQWTAVSIPAVCRRRFGRGPSCLPAAVGTDWIKYDEERGNLGDRWLFQNIVTGAVRNDPTNAHTQPDLDSPLLINPVCAPLRVPSEASQNTLERDGRFAILQTDTGIFLEHCATHLHELLTDATPSVTAAPAEVMWVSRPMRPLDGVLLPSRRRFTMSRPPGALLDDVEISARHIYVLGSTRDTNDVVWSAPLSALRGS
ncbi:MAG TPA: hypothetical protein VHW96_05610 [Solirubrobacteraceae bacterium]|nr:hypothetical protein [Solirubrobacteraceae bacterium]